MFAILPVSLGWAQSIGHFNEPRKAPKGEYDDPDGAVRLLVDYTRCFANDRPSVAESILNLPLHSDEQEAAIRKSFGGRDNCLNKVGGSLRIFAPSVLIAGLAQEQFLRRHRRTDINALVTAGSSVAPRNGWEAFSLCVVRRNPQTARGVLDARVKSPDEEAAVKALIPDLGPCVLEGTQLKLDRFAIRTYMAVGLYLLGRASGDQ
jgi:hypothetical protein